MNQRHTFIFFISILTLSMFTTTLYAQNDSIVKDSIVYKQKYGLRIGGDLSKIVRTAIDDDYTGFEINADYRLTKRIYLAGELGTEERTLSEDAINVTAKGSYFKAGIDYNLYRNWLNMENMIFAGLRIGASTFSQKLNSYSIYNVNNQYWDEQVVIESGEETDGLTALWTELMFGIKAEVFNNLYVGLNVQLKIRISDDQPNGFENLYIPGFNRTYDSGRFGAGFGYNISYLIPIFKKDKIVPKVTEEDN